MTHAAGGCFVTTINKRLIELKEERQVSLTQIAEESGIPLGSVKGALYTEKNLNTNTLEDFADYFGASCDWILGRTDVREVST